MARVLMATELNSLPMDSMSCVSPTIEMPIEPMWLLGTSLFLNDPKWKVFRGGFVEMWLLRTLDGGTTWEDGSPTVVPCRAADIIFAPEDNVAGNFLTARYRDYGGGYSYSGLSRFPPPAHMRCVVRNKSGWALPPSGNYVQTTFSTDLPNRSVGESLPSSTSFFKFIGKFLGR